jgi:hypothetical protein
VDIARGFSHGFASSDRDRLTDFAAEARLSLDRALRPIQIDKASGLR